MKPRYTDAFWGEHPFDGHMILIKNKNKNKVAEATVGAAERRADIQHEWHIAKKQF